MRLKLTLKNLLKRGSPEVAVREEGYPPFSNPLKAPLIFEAVKLGNSLGRA
jgi:hypothetical protein